jgi:hypothetical protein
MQMGWTDSDDARYQEQEAREAMEADYREALPAHEAGDCDSDCIVCSSEEDAEYVREMLWREVSQMR